MARPSPRIIASKDRLGSVRDAARAAFGFPAGLAMVGGLLAGYLVPKLDDWLDFDAPIVDFSTQDAARSMLETIATSTVAVAGISFSVTIVAFTLTANQLSPRVLRSFRRDGLSQLTLAAFLGSFIYCVSVLVRLGSIGPDRVPNLSVAVAVLLALVSFGLFAAFITRITNMLQPSTVIASIADDARAEQERPYPTGVGSEPDEPDRATAEVERQIARSPGRVVRSEVEGFLALVEAERLLGAAGECDGLVRQCAEVGDSILPGDPLFEVWAPDEEAEKALAEGVRGYCEVAAERTLPQDPGFPVQQLADVALKGLSPGINDPTTALNAMDTMAAGLIRLARAEAPARLRVDKTGAPRFLARPATVDGLARFGFEQAFIYTEDNPVVRERLVELLVRVGEEASRHGLARTEVDRLLEQVGRSAVPVE